MDPHPSRLSLAATVAAGLAGCAMVATMATSWYTGVLSPVMGVPTFGAPAWYQWSMSLTLVAATVLALATLRWWPYLLLAGGLVSLTLLAGSLIPLGDVLYRATGWVYLQSYAQRVAFPLALVGVLACAQALARRGATGRGAAVAGAALGAQLFGVALTDPRWLLQGPEPPASRGWLTILGLAGAAVAIARFPRGDRAAEGHGWSRLRFVVTGGLASSVAILMLLVTRERLIALLDAGSYALNTREVVLVGIIGLGILLAGVVLAAVGGVWSLAGALTAATLQIAIAAPSVLALAALASNSPVRWLAALAGVGLGVGASLTRWRVPLAAGGAVLGAVAVFIALAATNGVPERIIEDQATVPASLLLVLLAAVATTLVGATVPVLARRGAAPAVLGPIVAALVFGGMWSLEVAKARSSVSGSGSFFQPGSFGYNPLGPVPGLGTSATLMLAAAAAVGGLGGAAWLASRRAERRETELVRREAAAEERTRLARTIHDGVLQTLSLVQRHGAELGDRGEELARLASAQEVALRSLITSGGGSSADTGQTSADLRTLLTGLASPAVEVAVPADPVVLPAPAAGEVRAAVVAALDNVSLHAGAGAHAWVLVENEPAGVRVTVRDDGPGIPEGRLDEAAAAGRLGVAQSMRGRIADLGGTTTITSRPGEGAEVEFWIPREAIRE